MIEKVEILDYRLKELKAQVLYRIEDYDEALAVYEDIVKNADDDYSDERETNLGAVLVHLSKKKVCIFYTYFAFRKVTVFFNRKAYLN